MLFSPSADSLAHVGVGEEVDLHLGLDSAVDVLLADDLPVGTTLHDHDARPPLATGVQVHVPGELRIGGLTLARVGPVIAVPEDGLVGGPQLLAGSWPPLLVGQVGDDLLDLFTWGSFLGIMIETLYFGSPPSCPGGGGRGLKT